MRSFDSEGDVSGCPECPASNAGGQPPVPYKTTGPARQRRLMFPDPLTHFSPTTMVSLRGLLKISLRHPRPTASALRASAVAPASGSPFINNSQGASAAVAELSDALGTVFDRIDLDGGASFS